MEISWAQGYSGKDGVFIDSDTICQRCGHMVKFTSFDGSTKVFNPKTENVSFLAVHPVNKVFAVAESDVLDPHIVIFDYPWFNEVNVIEEAAQIDFTAVVFSHSDYLCTTSGVPDFMMIIWNYTSGEKLCEINLNHTVPGSLSFNPANWRQLCITSGSFVQMWTVEQCDSIYMLQKKVYKMPSQDLHEGGCYEQTALEQTASRCMTAASGRSVKMSVDVPRTSIAGLYGEQFADFEESLDDVPRAMSVCHTWNIHGDVYIGCQQGHIVKLEMEQMRLRVVVNPLDHMTRENTIGLSVAGEAEPSVAPTRQLSEAPVLALAMNRAGLYAAIGQPDCVLRLLVLSADGGTVTEVSDVHRMPAAVANLSFNFAYNRLAVGCEAGRMDILSAGADMSTKTLLDTHSGHVQAVVPVMDPSGQTKLCASVLEDGTIQIWDVANGALIGSLALNVPACSLASFPLAPFIVLGTSSGFLFFIDVSTPSGPRIVGRTRVHERAVSHIEFEAEASCLVALVEGLAFILHGEPSGSLEPFGFLEYPGTAQDLSLQWSEDKSRLQVAITSRTVPEAEAAASRITYFELTKDIMLDPVASHLSPRCDFRSDAIRKMELYLVEPKFGCLLTRTSPPRLLAVGEATRCLESVGLPEDVPKKAGNRASFLQNMESFSSFVQEEPTCRIASTPNGKLLATFGKDGVVRIAEAPNFDNCVEMRIHDADIKSAAFSPDGSLLLTSGADGSLVATSISSFASGVHKAKSDNQSFLADNAARVKDERLFLESQITWTAPVEAPPEEKKTFSREVTLTDMETPTPVFGADQTWLQVVERAAQLEEDKHYLDTKKALRLELRTIRKQVKEMVQENEALPDLERLDRHEFELDVEEQGRILSETEAVVQGVREDIEFSNLAKEFTHHIIKRECWDKMQVKGRSLRAFNTTMEVSNFAMKERTKEALRELEKVQAKRRLEITVAKANKEFADAAVVKPTTSAEDADEVEDEDVKDANSLIGSAGASLGGACELAYSQFDLHTREQKIQQVVLLQDVIHRIQEHFNKEFDDTFKKKSQELSKIKDKNVRIRKILFDLDLLESQPVTDPTFSTNEQPEQLLVVQDHEVTVEKYLTPAQQKKLEEERLAEEERKRKERMDNWRERGLEEMMHGVLEIKKEDELKKDVPKPAFMTQKPEEEWSEDEKKLAQEYERKVKELNEEREKYRKQLESELKKLTSFIDEGRAGFDEQLTTLFHKRIRSQMAVMQEQLKIWRLRFNLLVDEELQFREKELQAVTEEKRQKQKDSTCLTNDTRKVVERFRENYDILSAEDKVQEKNFKREFSDLPSHQVDQLFRLFKRRPRRGAGAALHTPATSNLGADAPLNPYADRPSTSRQSQAAKTAMEAALAEMDAERNMPEGIEISIWRRLCKARREKIEKEQMLKQRALDLAEMNAFLQRRQEEEEFLKTDILHLENQESVIRDDRRRFETNLQVQLLLKQGQVEVEPSGGFIHDFSDSILVHRSVVEDLNTKIRSLGEAKVQHMVEGKDFKKRFIHLEWELKKMTMEVEDLRNKMKDIQSFKISREVQRYLNAEDYDGLINSEIQKLEQAMGLLKKHHERAIQKRETKVKFISKHTCRKLDNRNEELDGELKELNVCLNERVHIDEVNDVRMTDAAEAEQRYRAILQRQKLVDLAKAQAKEVAVLRAEVERLRMRTFPALVQNK